MEMAGPVRAEERISSLDVIRGFALLGILLMNIVGFGLPSAYDDPTNAGGATGANLWVWIVMHILAEGKMRCLFSMVFGAGIILLTSRAEGRGEGASGADIYYRRNLWLGAFGFVHAYLLWQGEILYPYALCALALYAFRRMTPKGLIAIVAAMIVISAGTVLFLGKETQKKIAEGKAAEAAKNTGAKLTVDQEGALRKWEDLRKELKPAPAEQEKTIRRWRGNAWEVIQVRAEHVWHWHSLAYYHYYNLDVLSMMLLGMALFKLGIFSGERSMRFYALMAGVGYLIGLSVNSYSAYRRVAADFDIVVSAYSAVTYDIGRLSIALAHVGVLLVLVKAGVFPWLTRSLGAVGQLAFSNYVTHSVVCAFFFTGYGLRMYGRLERHQLYYVVGAIWVVQMIVSPIWLRHFHFGPAEWAWRSLTYWKKQPMRKRAVAAEAAAMA